MYYFTLSQKKETQIKTVMSKCSKREKKDKENKAKSWLLEKLSEIYQLLVKLTKGKKKENIVY